MAELSLSDDPWSKQREIVQAELRTGTQTTEALIAMVQQLPGLMLGYEALCDRSLTDVDVAFLRLVARFAGGPDRPFVTQVSSIARVLGRSARTIQSRLNSLVASGYIMHAFDRRTGLSTITVARRAFPAEG